MPEHLIAEVYFRFHSHAMKKGEVVKGHDHVFAHPTLILAGSMLIEVLDGPDVAEVKDEAGATLIEAKKAKTLREWTVKAWPKNQIPVRGVAAGTWHRLTALEDGTGYVCIYPPRNDEGKVVQEYEGRDDVYV